MGEAPRELRREFREITGSSMTGASSLAAHHLPTGTGHGSGRFSTERAIRCSCPRSRCSRNCPARTFGEGPTPTSPRRSQVFTAWLPPNSQVGDQVARLIVEPEFYLANQIPVPTQRDPSKQQTFAARSHHPGGVHASLCDGSVQFFSEGIDLELWRAWGGQQRYCSAKSLEPEHERPRSTLWIMPTPISNWR